jgi:hypothetical protein
MREGKEIAAPLAAAGAGGSIAPNETLDSWVKVGPMPEQDTFLKSLFTEKVTCSLASF